MTHCLVRHKVEDFTKWKAVYDEEAPTREKAGLKEVHLWRNLQDPSEVFILLKAPDLERTQALISSPAMAESMKRAGVIDKPDFYFIEEAVSRLQRAKRNLVGV